MVVAALPRADAPHAIPLLGTPVTLAELEELQAECRTMRLWDAYDAMIEARA